MPNLTMKEIARQAGITRQTVSEILNDKTSRVSKATRERVLKIARELNYRPNYLARSLKTGKTYRIGLMGSGSIIDISVYCFAKTIEGVENTLSDTKSRYSLMMFGANFNENPEKSYELIEQRAVDGMIFLVLAEDLERFGATIVPLLKELDLPFVTVHSTSEELPYHNVGLDSGKGGRLAAEHFIKLGYDRLGFFLRDPRNLQLLEALAGFKKGVAACGRNPDEVQVVTPVTIEDPVKNILYYEGRETIKKLARLPRALFFPDEGAAYGALKACAELGIRVPEDLAVIGFDDEEMPFLETTLTTIHHPFLEKGREAVIMLEEILEGKRDRKTIQRKVLEPQLVVRETCG